MSGNFTNQSYTIEKGIISNSIHQENKHEGNNLNGHEAGTSIRDTYKLNGMNDEQSKDLFTFMIKNTDVEWNLTLGNEAGGNVSNILTTSHKEGSVSPLVTYFQRTEGYTAREVARNHPSGNPTPSGIFGDQGHAAEIRKLSPNATFYIYIVKDNQPYKYQYK